MTAKLCVLFLYHKCDELTRRNLKALQDSNPTAVIIPVTDSVPEELPGSVDVGRFPSRWKSQDKWRSIDVTVYKWFENRTLDAERYIFIEYDCLVTVDLAEHYKEVWDADVACADYFSRAERKSWHWFCAAEIKKLSAEDAPFASGIEPFVCTMFSHRALERYLAAVTEDDVFCELRMGTTIRKLGLRCMRLPVMKRATVLWYGYPWKVERPGVFHSIKSLQHNLGKSSQPGLLETCLLELVFAISPRRRGGVVTPPAKPWAWIGPVVLDHYRSFLRRH